MHADIMFEGPVYRVVPMSDCYEGNVCIHTVLC